MVIGWLVGGGAQLCVACVLGHAAVFFLFGSRFSCFCFRVKALGLI